MITRMGILEKQAGMSKEDFNKHWLAVHAPLVKDKMKHLRRYSQNLIVNDQQLGIGFASRSELAVDGISELWFDDVYEMEHDVNSNQKETAADYALMGQNLRVILTFQRVVVPLAPDWENRSKIKRMTFLKRASDCSPEKFHYEWLTVHAEMVKKMPHVLGYNQNLIFDRQIAGKSVPYSKLPFDGVVEFWFEDVDKLEKCFASPEYSVTSTHGKSFLDTMTTYLVEETVIIP